MNDLDQDSVDALFFDVLEKMACMFGEPGDLDEIDEPDEALFEASMSFEGAGTGEIRLFVPGSLCTELAANVLGIDEEDDEAIEIGQDTLRELLNTLLGQLLTAMAGVEPVFDLTIPEVVETDKVPWNDALTKEKVYLYDVEDHPVLLDVSKIT